MAFTQILLFVLAVAGMVALVPLGVWFATGSRVQAWRALKGYGALMLSLLAFAGLGAVVSLVAAIVSS